MSKLKPNPRKNFFLFGYPISHSASPSFHNTFFKSLGLDYRYELSEAKTPEDGELLKLIRSPTFGGSAITMPIKVSIVPYLDSLGPAAKEIGSVNTIIVTIPDGSTKPQLMGENYDWQGIVNSLVRSLPSSMQTFDLPWGSGHSGYIIGGGGTTRAAVYGLSQLGISPIYLVNRDPTETAQIVAAFPQYDLRPIVSVEEWDEEKAKRCVVGVGAIPSIPPATDAEKMVYKIADKIFRGKGTGERRFLEMCYKPRRTTILEMAEAAGWTTVQGIEAMIEQALAQQRAWLLNSAASPFTDPIPSGLPQDAEERARAVVRGMGDIKDGAGGKL